MDIFSWMNGFSQSIASALVIALVFGTGKYAFNAWLPAYLARKNKEARAKGKDAIMKMISTGLDALSDYDDNKQLFNLLVFGQIIDAFARICQILFMLTACAIGISFGAHIFVLPLAACTLLFLAFHIERISKINKNLSLIVSFEEREPKRYEKKAEIQENKSLTNMSDI